MGLFKPKITDQHIHKALRALRVTGETGLDDLGIGVDVSMDGANAHVAALLPPTITSGHELIQKAIHETVAALPGAGEVFVSLRAARATAGESAPGHNHGPGAHGHGHGHGHGGGPGHQPLSAGGPGPGMTPLSGYAPKPPLSGVRHTIAIAAGKGGVGKSTVALNLALALSQAGRRVGLLDCDVFGPSLAMMTGLTERPMVQDQRILPLERFGLKIMSMGVLVDENQPVVWRGPMVNGAITQFLGDVDWGDLDIMILDLPPGTGDVQLTLVQTIPLTGAVIVCTPQDVALLDAVKAHRMFAGANVAILGYIENMSLLSCPHCGERIDVFGEGGAEKRAEDMGAPFLGSLPIDLDIRRGGDNGSPLMIREGEDTPTMKSMRDIAQRLQDRVTERMENEPAPVKIEVTRH